MSQSNKTTMTELNALKAEQFTNKLGGIFEHSAWVPRAAYPAHPFASLDTLHATMVAIVTNADTSRKLELLCAHPELAKRGTLTAASTAEQGSKGLDRLDAREAAQFDALNLAYRTRFGFPFIIAVRGQRDRAAILAALSQRVEHSQDQELATALAEVAKIARFRLEDMITDGN
jgi:2-oxo-4-hydroxy-4-carboxy-5-ureidoimidazoline decarboxylase